MQIIRKILVGVIACVSCAFSQSPDYSRQPQRLFAIPYGKTPGKVNFIVVPSHGEEDQHFFGPTNILVSPDGKLIALIGARESEVYDTSEEIDLFRSDGAFVAKIVYNSTRGYAHEHGLKPTEGFYLLDACFGLDGLLYVLCEQMHLDGTGRVQRIDVYDAQGARLTTLSERYTKALQGYPELYWGTMVGTDKEGRLYFDLSDQYVAIERTGARGWQPKSFTDSTLLISLDIGVLYLKRRVSRIGETSVYELWEKVGQRFVRQTKVSLGVDPLKSLDGYPVAVCQRRSYWFARRTNESPSTVVRTAGGQLHQIERSILVFGSDGQLMQTVSYTLPRTLSPAIKRAPFGLDAAGNIYVPRWSADSLEVLRYAVEVREEAK